MNALNGNPMATTVVKGALVQLLEDFGVIVPNIVPFQYNPSKITLGISPWNPFQTTQASQGSQSPLVQPFDPEQTYGFDLEFDGTDDVDIGNPMAIATGIGSRLAALRKLVQPSSGLISDLVGAVGALAGNAATKQAERPTVPVTLLILGTAVIVPVRVTSLKIDITEFTPLLYPMMAKATIELRVLTPDAFRCRETTATGVAIAAYNFTRAQDDALAIANVSNVGTAVASMVPL
ncbi:hypothetical protein CP98_01427 [Sphingobium yanoikuyae]|uniref:Uncharacterized protein n=1 Tax=Sphingobium yanoikuyae TaxID=13690 RepID=A0A084EQI0_SPHYA|nr:hypothetical protein [Sphingobium yanoikuyae]KEZ20222.1 hypothetical protein CP98_01427 [Sphingobium yanoikuyae]